MVASDGWVIFLPMNVLVLWVEFQIVQDNCNRFNSIIVLSRPCQEIISDINQLITETNHCRDALEGERNP
jgi:hypothetical protein